MAAKKKPTALAPEPFFAFACPRVLSIMRATCADLGGKYVIDIEGVGGWTLDFPTASVRSGADPKADLVLSVTLSQFESLQSPKVELKKLVATGAVRASGDASKIENVSLVLAFLSR